MNSPLTKEGEIIDRRRGPRLPEDEYRRRWIERVKARCVVVDGGCWTWQGFCGHKGYGATSYRNENMNLHRGMWIAVHGVRPTTEQFVCHRCDNRKCCNPEHLYLGTAADNNRDCGNKGRHHNGVKTHCKFGHPFTPENTRIRVTASTAMRTCITCETTRFRSAEYRARAAERARRYKQRKRSQVSYG